MEAFLEVLMMVSAAVGCADLAIRKGAGLNSNGDGSKLLFAFFFGNKHPISSYFRVPRVWTHSQIDC